MSDAKSGKVRQHQFILVVGIIFILLGAGLVFGLAAVVRNGNTSTNVITVDDTNTATINISLNVTDGNKAGGFTNLTGVFINLSVNGRFLNITDGTENTSVSTVPFALYNISYGNWSLNWSNSTYGFINASGGANINYFWFGVTPNGQVPVKSANISVHLYRANNSNLYNASNLTSIYNITLNVNDSFTVNYVGRSNVSGTNLSQNYIPLELNISGNQTTLSLRVSLHNSTGRIYNNISVGGQVVNNSGIGYNFSNLTDGTDLPEGTYVLEVIANNSDGDMNNTANRTYILDRTAPTVTLSQDNSSTATTKTQVTVTLAITDALTGINTTCDSTTSTATITGTGTSQTLVESGLNCGTTHSYAVTCRDTAGNRNAAVTLNTATLSCSSGASAGGSSGSGSTASGSTASGSTSTGNGTSSGVGGAGGSAGPGGLGSGQVGEQPSAGAESKLPMGWIVVVAVLVIVAIVYVVMSRKRVAK